MAQRAHLDRASEQLEFAERSAPGEQRVELRSLEVRDPLAAYADHVMVRAGVAIVTRALVQRRDLACLADLAQAFERAMDGGKRDPRMLTADARIMLSARGCSPDSSSARITARRCGVTAIFLRRQLATNSASRPAAYSPRPCPPRSLNSVI